MKVSKIDRLLLASGCQGTVARISVLIVAYLGMVCLPAINQWTVIHWGWSGASEKQLKATVGLEFIFKCLLVFGIAMEIVRLLVVHIRRRKRK
ncbi:hypothetical protein ACFSHT_02490 [Paraburkholderia silviterrae]|uniref:Uncharacterized protein n=1 Tax=Paraburkholderia silviterrae TaxID=2528715 RepID=A0A4R5MHS3_9BURK|nr:hypothetical protein [Paraburkholderia silviterrae]TDG26456.1 hypothetical protein EYW47_03685 [Paraburkholderia silviterrae]